MGAIYNDTQGVAVDLDRGAWVERWRALVGEIVLDHRLACHARAMCCATSHGACT